MSAFKDILLYQVSLIYNIISLPTGELGEEEKMKAEELQAQLAKQELSEMEQRKQLIQLSNLVDEQQKKLVEQERALHLKNDTLAFQADGLKEQQHNERQVAMVGFKKEL